MGKTLHPEIADAIKSVTNMKVSDGVMVISDKNVENSKTSLHEKTVQIIYDLIKVKPSVNLKLRIYHQTKDLESVVSLDDSIYLIQSFEKKRLKRKELVILTNKIKEQYENQQLTKNEVIHFKEVAVNPTINQIMTDVKNTVNDGSIVSIYIVSEMVASQLSAFAVIGDKKDLKFCKAILKTK